MLRVSLVLPRLRRRAIDGAMWWLGILLGLTVLTTPLEATAKESNKAVAEALFNEGRTLMSEGRYAEAVEKLKASQDLDPGLGTLLNLAECYYRLGRTATAWAQYREAAAVARQTGAREREELAESKSRELEPNLSKLSIRLAPGTHGGLVITRDGEAVRQAEIGVPIPIDPGAHVIEATQPGKQPWSTTVELGSNAETQVVEIPVLADATPGAPTPPNVPPPPAGDSGKSTGDGGSTQQTLGLVAGGVGIVGVAVGSLFGLRASSTWSDAKKSCEAYPYECGNKGEQLERDARSQATWSTVGFVVGGVFLAGGAALYLTADSSSEESVAVGVGPTSITVKGSF